MTLKQSVTWTRCSVAFIYSALYTNTNTENQETNTETKHGKYKRNKPYADTENKTRNTNGTWSGKR